MVKDEDTVLDILQDTYVKAFASLNQLQDASKFRAWVKRIAYNKTVDYLRKAKPVMFSQMSTDADEMIEFEDDNLSNMPEVVIDQNETKRLIVEILDSIPDEQRAVIAMHYYEGISIKEIAETLGVTENTIKSRLSYGRKKIEVKVKELEKKGTKLYGAAPLPFLLLLFRSQDAHAAEIPNAEVAGNLGKEFAAKYNFPKKPQPSAGTTVAKTAASKTTASTAGKGVLIKVIAGIAAGVVIGGGAVGIALHNNNNKADTTPVVSETVQGETQESATESQTVQETAGIAIEDFEGIYRCPDTFLEITITKTDDTTAEVNLNNISPTGANAVNITCHAKLEGEQLVIDFETEEKDMGYITKSRELLNVDISENFQEKANTYMSGVYSITKPRTVDEFIGDYETREGDHLESYFHVENGVFMIGDWSYNSYKIEGDTLYAYYDDGIDYDSYTLQADGSIYKYSTIIDGYQEYTLYKK